jgi:outer membrane lipoprotein-sorting protein
MGPPVYEAQVTMVAHRDDDSTRTYAMRMLKKDDDRFRIWFKEPAAVRGQEVLRQGDNAWLYMPNLKRTLRMASRDSFQGGDFNNADVLRVNYAADYAVKLSPEDKGAVSLELTAKTPDAAYDRIVLWMDVATAQPLRGEYYSASGKLLRSARFDGVKDFGGYTRPGHVSMRNEVAPKRFTELTFERVDVKVTPAAERFVLDDLGK